MPKVIGNNQGRKNIPSFAGNINIGQINPAEKPTVSQAPQRTQVQPKRLPPQQPQRAQPQRFPAQQPQRAQIQPQRLPVQQQQPQQQFPRQPQQQQFLQQPQQQQFPQQQRQQFVQQQQFLQQPQPQQQQQFPQQSFSQGLNRFQPGSEASQPLSLFDQIKNKINQGNARQQSQRPTVPQQQAIRQPQLQQQQPQFQQSQPQTQFQQPPSQFQQRQFQQPQRPTSNFGVFEAVSLGERTGGPSQPQELPRSPQQNQRSPQDEGFFGVFPEVNLQ